MGIVRSLLDYVTLNRHLYRFSEEKIRRWQARAVLDLVALSRRESPFYRELYAGCKIETLDDFATLPIINKSVMMANFDQLNTAGLRLSEVMDFAVKKELAQDYLGYFKDSYVVGLSSGTSGNKGIYVTPRALTERLPGVFLARGGVRLSDLPLRILFVLRVFSQGFSDINAPGIALQYRSSMTEPEAIVSVCNQMRTNILMAPPSFLRQLLPYHRQITSPFRRIITYAEVLDPLEKERFALAFKTQVVEIYQASEGQIASPCRHGSLHVNEDLIYLELLDARGRPVPDEPGQRCDRMLVTNLVNTVQPLIRYEMNDIVELGGPCPCGSRFRVLSRVIGRNDDVLYLKTRSGSLRPVYPDLISRWIITTDDRIRDFVVEQTAPDHLSICLDIGDLLGSVEEEAEQTALKKSGAELTRRLRERLTLELAVFEIDCELTFRIELIRAPKSNGKRKRFINLIRQEK